MDEDSFDDEAAARSLRYVKQLGEWSHRILVVSGTRGAGRAALFQLLSNHVEPGSRAARVNGAGLASPLHVWGAVAFGLGLDVPDSATQSDLEGKILAHSRELAESGHLDIILIDNADQLSDSVSEALLTLMDKSRAFDSLRLVLFGGENFAEGFDLLIAAFAPDVGWHHTPLTRETVAAAERHLERRLARGGSAAREQSGLDLDLDELEPRGVSASHRGFPWIHIVVGGSIALVLLALLVDVEWFMPRDERFGGDIPTPLEALEARLNAEREAASAAPEAGSAVPEPTSAVPETTSAVPETTSAAPEPTSAVSEATSAPLSPKVEVIGVRMPPDTAQTQSEPAPIDAKPVSMPGTWLAEAADDGAAEDEPPEDTRAAGISSEVTPGTEPLAVEQLPDTGDTPQSTEAAEVRDVVQIDESSQTLTDPDTRDALQPTEVSRSQEAPKPADEVSPVAPQEIEELTPPTQVSVASLEPTRRGAAWILEQHPDAFVLQLFGVTSRERLGRFLDAQPATEPFAYFETRRGGSPWYVVLYGVYPDRASASRGASRLPSSLGGSPWIRPFGDVQRDIQGAR